MEEFNTVQSVFVFGGYAQKFGGVDPKVFVKRVQDCLPTAKVHWMSTDYTAWGIDQNSHRDSIEEARDFVASNSEGSPTFIGFSIGAHLAISLAGIIPVNKVLGFLPPTNLGEQKIGKQRQVQLLDERFLDLQHVILTRTEYLLVADREITTPANAHSYSQIVRLDEHPTVQIKALDGLRFGKEYFYSQDFEKDLELIGS